MSPEEQLLSEVKFFTKVGSVLFLGTAKGIRDISLKESSAEGLSGIMSGVIKIGGAGVGAGVGAAISGPASIGPGAKLGKIAGDFVNKGISGILQVSNVQKIVLEICSMGPLIQYR